MNATYSPEDNKIRIYPDKRLDPETYARVKATGFIWAPKQEIFVAPMWTPEREDLAAELCGEIGDEDMSLIERAEERAERFEEYSEKRETESARAMEAVKEIGDQIPFGQPILVGHHSEKHARKDAERIENGMRRAVNLWETSKYWEQRATAAIRHAKYKERPDVRARRIKGLEADSRKQTKERDEKSKLLKFYSDSANLEKAMKDGRNLAFELLKTWEGGLGSENRGELEKGEITRDEALEIAKRNLSRGIAYAERWIGHLINRIAYERAMLADSGGTVADRTGPEKGGAVRCWVGRGWLYITRVNKISVSVEDNWGNQGANFARTVPFDKLTAIMTAAQVREAREAGRLVENEFKTGFFLTDDAPKVRAETPKDPNAETIEGLKKTLEAGVKAVVVPCLFPTPHTLAARMVDLAELRPGMNLLEPSAGTGNLIAAALRVVPVQNVVAVEKAVACWNVLPSTFQGLRVFPGDFLEKIPGLELEMFDRILMNPPFDHGSDIVHIQHARKFLKPGGRLVAICAGGPKQAEVLKPLSSFWEELPAGTFEGTQVRSVLLVIDG